MMKKWWLMTGVLSLSIFTAACGNEVDGKGPDDVAIEWVNADVQGNEAKQFELLSEKEKEEERESLGRNILDENVGKQNDYKIEKYKLTEYKQDDDHYFYKVEYVNPNREEEGSLGYNDKIIDNMEIERTDSGWKRTQNMKFSANEFESKVEGLEPKVLKELHDE